MISWVNLQCAERAIPSLGWMHKRKIQRLWRDHSVSDVQSLHEHRVIVHQWLSFILSTSQTFIECYVLYFSSLLYCIAEQRVLRSDNWNSVFLRLTELIDLTIRLHYVSLNRNHYTYKALVLPKFYFYFHFIRIVCSLFLSSFFYFHFSFRLSILDDIYSVPLWRWLTAV